MGELQRPPLAVAASPHDHERGRVALHLELGPQLVRRPLLAGVGGQVIMGPGRWRSSGGAPRPPRRRPCCRSYEHQPIGQGCLGLGLCLLVAAEDERGQGQRGLALGLGTLSLAVVGADQPRGGRAGAVIFDAVHLILSFVQGPGLGPVLLDLGLRSGAQAVWCLTGKAARRSMAQESVKGKRMRIQECSVERPPGGSENWNGQEHCSRRLSLRGAFGRRLKSALCAMLIRPIQSEFGRRPRFIS